MMFLLVIESEIKKTCFSREQARRLPQKIKTLIFILLVDITNLRNRVFLIADS